MSSIPLFTSLNPFLSPLPSPPPRFSSTLTCLHRASVFSWLARTQPCERCRSQLVWLLCDCYKPFGAHHCFVRKLKENLFKTFLACSLIFRARDVKVSCEFEFHLSSRPVLKGVFQCFRCQCQFTSHRKYYSAKDSSCLISSVA